MHRYSTEQIFDNLRQIDNITVDIRKILDEQPKVSRKMTRELMEHYSKRRELLVNVNEWAKSEEGRSFISRNSEVWDSYLAGIMEKDKNLIKDIKDHVDNLSIELKKLMNNKKVLIYTKR